MGHVKISPATGSGEQQIRKFAEPGLEPLMILYCFHILKILNFAGKYIFFASNLAINLTINFIVINSFIVIYKTATRTKTDEKSVNTEPIILYGKPNISEPVCPYGHEVSDNPFFRVRTILFETRKKMQEEGTFNRQLLESIFHTSKKTIQEYVREIERHNRYRSVRSNMLLGTVLDDRSRLIDLYDACLQQDAHIRAVIETLESQILGDRYMLARQNDKGKYVKDVKESQKIQGSQFDKIIRGVIEAKLYGYTLLEIMPDIDPDTGRLKEVNSIERRNVLPDQGIVVQRQGLWLPHWDIRSAAYRKQYVLIKSGDLGLFSATTPLILAKKFTVANYVNFSHTYGQPIIHGKTVSENNMDRKRLAQDISNAAQNKVIVTGLEDEVDIKTFTMSNSEKIYTGLIEFANKEVSNLILGSESMAGGMQSYVGSTKAHQDIFRDRIEVYRRYIENVMNEQIVPRLVAMGYISAGLEFKYSNRIDMNNEDRIKLYQLITDKYEVAADEIEKEFGIAVGKQLNVFPGIGGGGSGIAGGSSSDRGIMSDEEYYKRYGHPRGVKNTDTNPSAE